MRPTPDKMRAFLAQLKTKMNLRSLVVTLAAIVVFTTTYLLVLPAFTLEKEEAMEQGGIDIAAEQTVEIVDEEAPAEQAEKPAADADAEASVESVTDEETVVQENKAPAENNTDSKPEAADTKADSKPETVNTKADSKPETVNTEADDKQEVKLLTRKTTLTAEKAKGADFEVSAVVGKAAKVPEDTMLQATELTKDTEGFDYDKYYDEALKALKADSGDTMTIKSIKFYDISLESETQEESVEPKSTVNVKIAYEEGIEVEDADSVRVVHFTENSKGKVVPEVLDKKENKVETVVDTKESKLTEASFDTDGFSKYAIVETEIEKYVLASDGHKYRITATYGPETGIPGDADLEVEEILSTSKEYAEYVSKTENALGMEEDSAEYIRLFDISIVDKNNPKIKYQPKKGTAVDVRIELDDSSSKDLNVVHFADENSAGDVVDSSKDGKAIEFEASGFSVYAVIGGPEPTARMELKFHVKSATGVDTVVATMFVKRSDTLEDLKLIVYDPYIGALAEGEVFRGWSFKENYTIDDATTPYNATEAPNGAMSIDDIRNWVLSQTSTITGGEDMGTKDFYAMILKHHTVRFYDPSGVSIATNAAYFLRSETSANYNIQMTYTSTDEQHNFRGWIIMDDTEDNVSTTATLDQIQLDVGGTVKTYNLYKVSTAITLTGDVNFTAYAPAGAWLIYHEVMKGATYHAAEFLLPTETAVLPGTPGSSEQMTLLGYEFDGWYKTLVEEKDPVTGEVINRIYSDPVQSPLQVLTKTNLYAKWKPVEWAPYTVIVWKENLDNPGTYSYAESIRLYGVPGTKISIGDGTGSGAMLSKVDNDDADYLYIKGKDQNHNDVTITKETTNTRVGSGSNVSHTYTNEPYIGFNCEGFKASVDDKNYIQGTDDSVTINPEGNSVINVYYDRIEYTVKVYFASNDTPNGNGYHLFHYRRNNGNNPIDPLAPWNMDNTYHYDVSDFPYRPSGNDPVAGIDYFVEEHNGKEYYYTTITARYGEDISADWPRYSDFPNATVTQGALNGKELTMISWYMSTDAEGYQGKGSGLNTFKGIITTMDKKILGDINKAEGAGNVLVSRYDDEIYYYTYQIWKEQLEDIDYSSYETAGKTRTKTVGDKTYKFYLDDEFVSNSSASDPKKATQAPDYRGFTNLESLNLQPPPVDHRSTCEFYYERIKNPIIYRDGSYFSGRNVLLNDYPALNPDQRSADILYEADISSYGKGGLNYKTDYPASYDGFLFEGWYLDDICTQECNFNGMNMPDSSITVYAKFRQIEYRVFFRPNIPSDVPDNVDVSFGAGQAMNFRIAHEGLVDLPTGKMTLNGLDYDEYEFAGWYLDEDFHKPFDTDAYPVNNTITVPYDKTEPTDVMDTRGRVTGGPSGNGWNSDTLTENENHEWVPVDRWWLTRKLNLYAKWSKNLHEIGITVQYDPNGGKINGSTAIYEESEQYKDNSDAVAYTAPAPPEGSTDVFRYWVLQTWDPDANDGAGGYVDVSPIKTVSPGDIYVVKFAYTHEVTSGGVTKYIMRLRAEYGEPEEPKDTFIWWYNNFDTLQHIETNDLGDTQEVVEAVDKFRINEGVNIKPADTFTRDGWEFIGWARLPIRDNEANFLEGEPKVHDELKEDDLFLKYDAATDSFKAQDKQGNWVNVTQVAADEKMPYHDLYAVWKPATVPIKVIKVDQNGEPLEGATFEFGDKDFNGDTGIPYTSAIGTYDPDDPDAVIVESGSVGVGTYVISETDAPDGYNKMDKPVSITVAASQPGGLEVTVSYDGEIGFATARIDSNHPEFGWVVTIRNDAGIELPHTGGIGTTIFYILGSLLVAGCGIVLVSRRRMKNK